MLTKILSKTNLLNASDLHLSAGKIPVIRVNGILQLLGNDVVTKDDMQKILQELLPAKELDSFRKNGEVDYATEKFLKTRLRINAYQEHEGVAIAMRILQNDIPNCHDLGLPIAVQNLADLKHGLVLIAGATGSGKTTTLAALIDKINSTRMVHVLTLEDPVEYVHLPKLALIHQREIGRDTTSFATGLRSALREDPDVIMVGELRDAESIAIALTAAETGHLVLATVHTRDVTGTIHRILDVLPNKEQGRTQLADCLQAVVCQTLLPRLDRTGRVPAFEILIATDALRNLIREARTHQLSSYMQMGAKQGMVLMDDYIKELRRSSVV